eukprot:TRINITY_DN11843_c0_g1_i1.p1 TRINITY_DN11843_c0_g1~~TRINITY_DN11843_c0_g1_i1.p1  ORF type:complete len:590 (+),score=104.23 TRINITY_DN11843_c0_g1_i1:62-1831(+)
MAALLCFAGTALLNTAEGPVHQGKEVTVSGGGCSSQVAASVSLRGGGGLASASRSAVPYDSSFLPRNRTAAGVRNSALLRPWRQTCPRAVLSTRPREAGEAPSDPLSTAQRDEHGPVKGAEEADTTQKNDELFRWPEAWYPIMLVSELDPVVPKAVTVLGRPMVIWWDRVGAQWQVFHDQCPHRLAPLSEGRIHESGQLQCSYHGWTFGGDGSCGLIPQASNEAVKRSPRACAQVVPSAAHQGMLFVWPDWKPGAAERAAQSPLPYIPELDDPTFSFDITSRVLPYGADSMIENLMDPAHVPFAHHKIMGRRDAASPLNLKVNRMYTSGFEGEADRGGSTFIAPCLWTTRTELPPKPTKEGAAPEPARRMVFVFFCTPIAPGLGKVFYAFPNNFIKTSWIPRWYRHMGQLTILDSDLYFLHLMERRLQAEGGVEQWATKCFVPIGSDGYVAGYRRWFLKHGGGSFEWAPGTDPRLPPTPPKEQLMDRYHSHVVECSACKQALRSFRALQLALGAAAFALLAGLALRAALVPPPSVPPLFAGALVLLAGACAGACTWLSRFIYRTYYFHDYCHALVDASPNNPPRTAQAA